MAVPLLPIGNSLIYVDANFERRSWQWTGVIANSSKKLATQLVEYRHERGLVVQEDWNHVQGKLEEIDNSITQILKTPVSWSADYKASAEAIEKLAVEVYDQAIKLV
jgi:hypothetical protein